MGLLGSVLKIGAVAGATVLGGPAAGAAVASGLGAASGAKSKNKGAKKAAAAMQTAADNNNALATAQFTPYTQAGATAMGQGNALLGLGTPEQNTAAFSTFQQSPGYQFRLGEGMNQLNSGLASAGVLQSGAAQRAAVEYGQNFASNEFDRYFGRVQNQAQLGLGASNALVGNVSANNIYAADGNANAALIRGMNNPLAAGLGAFSGSLSGGGNGGTLGSLANMFGMKF